MPKPLWYRTTYKCFNTPHSFQLGDSEDVVLPYFLISFLLFPSLTHYWWSFFLRQNITSLRKYTLWFSKPHSCYTLIQIFSFTQHIFIEYHLGAKNLQSNQETDTEINNSENGYDNVPCGDIACGNTDSDRQQSAIGSPPWQRLAHPAHLVRRDNVTHGLHDWTFEPHSWWQDFTMRPISINWEHKTFQVICSISVCSPCVFT